MPMSIAAIVLAAGASSRLGQPKQLLICAGETMIDRAIRLAGESGASPVIAVLGAHHGLIRETALMPGATPIVNGSWQQGISTSIQAGLASLEESAPQTAGALILGCDQPQLTTAHLRALLERFQAQTAASIVASAYTGIRGVPAVFPREVFGHLRALRGDKGARLLLMQPPCPLVELPFPGGEIDIDLSADLAHLK
jgi:CTP:molybdopterin cytidylyltransferase MocA